MIQPEYVTVRSIRVRGDHGTEQGSKLHSDLEENIGRFESIEFDGFLWTVDSVETYMIDGGVIAFEGSLTSTGRRAA